MSTETHFTTKEIKAIYRVFKDISTAAIMHRDSIRNLFMGFFQGDTEHYADMIFNTFDGDNSGAITFDVNFCFVKYLK